MNPNSKQFKDLQKIWYDKIKKAGFNEIEQPNGLLISWESSRFKEYKLNGQSIEGWQVMKNAQIEYYTMARQWLHEHTFKSKKDKHLWELHADGVSYREIQKLTGINFKVVQRKMKALVEIMFQERKLNDVDDTE
jgi:hypothetical protein